MGQQSFGVTNVMGHIPFWPIFVAFRAFWAFCSICAGTCAQGSLRMQGQEQQCWTANGKRRAACEVALQSQTQTHNTQNVHANSLLVDTVCIFRTTRLYYVTCFYYHKCTPPLIHITTNTIISISHACRASPARTGGDA